MKFCCLELLSAFVQLANEDVTGDILSTTEANTSEHADFVLQSICLTSTHLPTFLCYFSSVQKLNSTVCIIGSGHEHKVGCPSNLIALLAKKPQPNPAHHLPLRRSLEQTDRAGGTLKFLWLLLLLSDFQSKRHSSSPPSLPPVSPFNPCCWINCFQTWGKFHIWSLKKIKSFPDMEGKWNVDHCGSGDRCWVPEATVALLCPGFTEHLVKPC